MSADRESKLKLYSLGIVIEDKAKGSDIIKVMPIEEMAFNNGDITEQSSTYQITTKDAKGIDRSDKATGDNNLVAKWFPDGHDNRWTSPDVVKGETVKIYRFGDTDEYHWSTMFREPSLRRLETVCYGFGNLPAGKGELNKEGAYWLEVSTDGQYLHLHTSKSNGEPFEYDIILDTSIGNLTVKDDVGNFFTLDSADGDITGNALNSLSLKATTLNFEAENINMKGSVNSEGSISNNGDLSLSGSISVDGAITASGTVHGSNI